MMKLLLFFLFEHFYILYCSSFSACVFWGQGPLTPYICPCCVYVLRKSVSIESCNGQPELIQWFKSSSLWWILANTLVEYSEL